MRNYSHAVALKESCDWHWHWHIFRKKSFTLLQVKILLKSCWHFLAWIFQYSHLTFFTISWKVGLLFSIMTGLILACYQIVSSWTKLYFCSLLIVHVFGTFCIQKNSSEYLSAIWTSMWILTNFVRRLSLLGKYCKIIQVLYIRQLYILCLNCYVIMEFFTRFHFQLPQSTFHSLELMSNLFQRRPKLCRKYMRESSKMSFQHSYPS